MRMLLLAGVLVACESTTPQGGLFEAAPSSTAPTEAPPAEVTPTDSAFDFEPFEMSSEELHGAATTQAPEPEPAPEPAAPPEPSAEPAPEPAPAPAPTVQIEQEITSFVSTPTGWPLRLVKTLPDTQPPRAILGLPDGTELVVKPGSMVPDMGVVVISVGRSQVEVARVTAEGDHANVSSQTLQAQF